MKLTIKRLTASLLLSTLSMSANAQLLQTNLANFADNAKLVFETKDNFDQGEGKHQAGIAITNNSTVALPAGKSDWQIYIHYIRLLDKTITKGLLVEHVMGDLHRITPTKEFRGLAVNESLELLVNGKVWIVSDSDFMPNAFIVSPDENGELKAATFANTATGNAKDYVKPFVKDKQLLRYSNPTDLFPIANAKRRFDRNRQDKAMKVHALSVEQAQTKIIPTPIDVKELGGKVVIDEQWAISYAGRLSSEGKYLADEFQANTGIKLDAKANHISQPGKSLIEIKVDPSIENGKAESYQLAISNDNIVIIGSDNAGAYYGIESLLALIPANSKTQKSGKVNLPLLQVKDSPRFTWRGMHYDMARNFHSKKVTLQLIEQMGRYKLNKLHLHLTDDEGWRVEIPDLPELTEIGGKRCFDLSEQNCLLTQLGTGPSSEGVGNGFYSKDDFVEILKYAAARHIEIIPEVDMPGHARAAIKSMEGRYNKLMAEGKPKQANAFLLSEQGDTSEYLTVQNYTDNSVNVCLDSTYRFVDKIVYEFEQMYREAGLKITKLHIGGDEVGRGSWTESDACKVLFNQVDNGVAGVNDLKPYFTARVAEILNKKGISMGAWEDGMMSDAISPFNRKLYGDNEVMVNAWDNIWEFGVADRAYRLANEDYKVILSSATHLYFDHPYEAHPQERGYYWASRYTNTKKVFGFKPDNLYANADFMLNGAPIVNLEAEVGRELMALKKPENILGMQGQVWSETIRTPSQLNEMVYPRLIALAQKAWHKAAWESNNDSEQQAKSWAQFASVLVHKEFGRLTQDDVEYYLPVPGGQIVNGKLEANVDLPEMVIQYSEDNGDSWQEYTKKVSVAGDVLLRTIAIDGRYSRETKVN